MNQAETVFLVGQMATVTAKHTSRTAGAFGVYVGNADVVFLDVLPNIRFGPYRQGCAFNLAVLKRVTPPPS